MTHVECLKNLPHVFLENENFVACVGHALYVLNVFDNR
jgi:hypothetical protein